MVFVFAEWGTPTEGKGELLPTTGRGLRRYKGEKEGRKTIDREEEFWRVGGKENV